MHVLPHRLSPRGLLLFPIHPAADMFTHIAFAKPACGDCLIDALITASGPRGLAAFLPSHNQVFHPPQREARMWDREEPILPMTNRWQDADFSIANVVRAGQDIWAGEQPRAGGGVSLRDWSIKLLSRYAYIYGEPPCTRVWYLIPLPV